jgi:hypothetical protein
LGGRSLRKWGTPVVPPIIAIAEWMTMEETSFKQRCVSLTLILTAPAVKEDMSSTPEWSTGSSRTMRRLHPKRPVRFPLSSSGLELGKKAHGKNIIEVKK